MGAKRDHQAPPSGLPFDVLAGRLAHAMARPSLSVDIISGRARLSFSPGVHGALTRHFAPGGVSIALRELRTAPPHSTADVVLLICHLHKEEPGYLAALRDGGYGGVIVSWLWDNHHAKDANRRVAGLSDVTIASHDIHAGYLAGRSALFRSVKLSCTQWARDEAAAFWDSRPAAGRRRDLYGGFVRYPGTPRTALLETLVASGRYPALRLLDGERGPGYFAKPPAARFHEWAGFAVSLCLPYRNDLSNRFFDAWLTGQIPVVTPDIAELTSPWAAPYRDRHFVCAASYEAADLDAAHARALALFDEGGVAGQEERHRLALTRHLFVHRVDEILNLLRSAGRDLPQALHPVART